MKKVIIILLVLLYCIDSIGQAISNRSSSTITVKDSRWMAGLNAFVPVYTDTTTANLTANIGIDSCGAIIFTYDNNNIWYRGCSPKRWLAMGSGQIINDTIYTERPIAVKVDSSGRHIIYFLTARGLISGGIVTLDSCMTIDVNNTVFNLNYNQYTVPQTSGIVISAADPTFGRVDRIVVDTNLNVVVIPGTPSSSPLPAPIDIFSQFELMQITVPAGATCLNINQEIIYDQNIEWTITTSGTITEDPDNTANPYHLTKAIFVSSYHNGSSIIFTDSSPDTVTAGELLKMFIYINGAFTNQISGQWYNGSTSVSNQISLNPYFNTNDSTKYQNLDVPFTAWNFTSTILNRFVLTFGGDDISGAKGLYLDYIQLQKGLSNLNPLDFVDSNRISNDSLFYYKHGLSFYVGQVGGSGGGGLNIYNGDSSLSSSRTLELNDKFLKISQGGADVAIFDGTGGGLGVDAIELTAMNDPNSNRTSLNIQSFPDSSYFALDNTFNDGEHITKIHGTADAISGRMELTADTLTFNGTIIYNTPTSGLSTDSILTRDAATGIVNMRDASSFGGHFVNSLQYAFDSSIVHSDNPIINVAANTLNLEGTNANPVIQINNSGSGVTGLYSLISGSGNAFQAYTDDGFAVSASAVAGSAGFFQNNDEGSAASMILQRLTSSTNTVQAVLRLQRDVFTTAANGIGGSIDFELGGAAQLSNQIISKFTDFSGATSELSFTGLNATTPEVLLTISGAGIFTLVQGLPSFANNAAAVSGGLTSGQLYRISVAGTSTVAIVE